MTKSLLIPFLLAALVGCASSSSQSSSSSTIADGIAADRAGDYKTALRIFQYHAEQGDANAMVNVGLKYYLGQGVPLDYCIAMDWFLKAFEKKNGDAYSNLGVMHRDGQCVPKNRKIAYTLFLATHMMGLGTESTQIRANKNLRREVAELPKENIQEALCYTSAYIQRYVQSRGQLTNVPPDVLPSPTNIRLKDNNWWLGEEKKGMNYLCPVPWNA